MHKLLMTPLLLISACIISGIYGVIHNQISYTVSPGYFHEFKFVQFHIPAAEQNRLGASIVGFFASWWMGLIIGVILVPFSLWAKDVKSYFLVSIKSYGVVAITAFIVGITALLISFLLVDPETIKPIQIFRKTISDPVSFTYAGTMHNFSYLGGIIGIVTGAIFILRHNKRPNQSLHGSGPQ